MTAQDWASLGQEMMPFAGYLAKWGMLSAEQFGQRFKDPFLRRALPQMFAWTSIPTMVGMSLLAYMHNGNAGFTVGASMEFARAIEKRYLELGGQIHYGAQVERILVENGRAVGVRLYTMTRCAGRVISL
jgi:phytoene dehydrogenase-like protein